MLASMIITCCVRSDPKTNEKCVKCRAVILEEEDCDAKRTLVDTNGRHHCYEAWIHLSSAVGSLVCV